MVHVPEAWQLGQEWRASVAPGGALAASDMIAVAFRGVFSCCSEECLQGTGRTLPRASFLPRGPWTSAWLSTPLPVSPGPWPAGCPLPLLFVQYQLLAHPPPGQELKEASPFGLGSLAQSGSVPQLDLKDIWGEGYPGMPRLIAWALKLTFYKAVLYLCGEMCHLSPTQFTLFSCFVKNKNKP